MIYWAIKVRVAHTCCTSSLISLFKSHEFFLSLVTIDPLASYAGSRTPPSYGNGKPTLPISRPNTSPLAESTLRCRKRRLTAPGEKYVYFHCRSKKHRPKLKALRAGETVKTDVWLGGYSDRQMAVDVFRIAAFYYDRKDCLTPDFVSWCEAYPLPSIPPDHLSDEKKSLWIRELVQAIAPEIPRVLGAWRTPWQEQDSPLPQADHSVLDPSSVAEIQEGGGHVVPEMSNIWEGGSDLSLSMDANLAPCGELPFETCTFPSVDEYINMQADSTQGEIEPVSGQGVESIGLSLQQTCEGQGAYHNQAVQDLQQSHGSVLVMERGGDEPKFAATINASIVAQELEFTDTMQSTLQELHERGWNWTIQRHVSTKLSVAFSGFADQDFPKLTASNYSAFQEFHKQGWKITLEPVGSASSQDSTGRPQPGSSSRDLCSFCNARRFDFVK